MSRENYVATVESWRRILEPMNEEEANAPDIRKQRAELSGMYDKAQELVQQRRVLQAQMQTATRELQAVLQKGRINASYLRKALKFRHGRDSEELVRFGMQPARKRSRSKKDPAPQD